MKSLTTWFALSLAATLVAGAPSALQAKDDLQKLEKDTAEAIDQLKKTDSGLKKLFDTATGYAVFPRVGKGGLIIGAAHGEGLVYEKGKLIGRSSLTQVTVGAQIGGQELSEVIFFETQEALAHFKEGSFAMSAQVSAVAASEGASQNAKYVDGVMVFTKARTGLMAEASVGGQKFKFEPIKK
jgi:lipid-binding SYLF domain-containing protein